MSPKMPPEDNPHLDTTPGTPVAEMPADPAEAAISPTLPLTAVGTLPRATTSLCTVYTKPSCPFSSGTVAFLCTYGVSFDVVNVEHYPSEKERAVKALAGGKFETPTLHLQGHWWVAPTLSNLKKRLVALGISPQPRG